MEMNVPNHLGHSPEEYSEDLNSSEATHVHCGAISQIIPDGILVLLWIIVGVFAGVALILGVLYAIVSYYQGRPKRKIGEDDSTNVHDGKRTTSSGGPSIYLANPLHSHRHAGNVS